MSTTSMDDAKAYASKAIELLQKIVIDVLVIR